MHAGFIGGLGFSLEPISQEDADVSPLRSTGGIRAAVTADIAHADLLQARLFKPLLDIGSLKSHPAIMMFFAQKIKMMGVQIGDHEFSARAQNPSHLDNRFKGAFDMVQVHIGKY